MSRNNTLESEQLTDSMYYILLSLIQVRHGYAIMKFIEDLTDREMVMGPGTLYTLLKKLTKAQWIVQVLEEQGDRTKAYQITMEGKEILKKELRRRKRMVELGEQVLLEVNDEDKKIYSL